MTQDPELLQHFAVSLAGRAPNTIQAYLSTLRGFVGWLAKQPGGKPFRIELLTETAIQGYLEALADDERAPRTRSQALTVLSRFCRWAMGEGLLSRNPAHQIQRPTVIATAPRELTPQQRYILKNQVEATHSPRLLALFALGYWAGLRISEIAHLRLADCQVNQRAGAITIVDSKGGKTRTLDLHNQARRALYAYLKTDLTHQAARDPESDYLFTSQRAAWLRQQGRPDHLTARGIEHVWLKLKRRATQEEWSFIHDITFHDLRHDFAHRARAAGWALEEIAVYLGHQTQDGVPAIATTARYTLPSRQQLKKQLKHLQG